MTKRVVIVGAGVIGLASAYYLLRRGHQVTVLDREPEQRDSCSYGNAGMIVPSHFTPLAAPGMVALGLKWMWNPESPFYIKPRLNMGLLNWGLKFWQAATPARVASAAPLLRDLSMASRQAFTELENEGLDFGLHQRGLLMLCRTQHGLDEEAAAAQKAQTLGIPAEVMTPAGLAKADPQITMKAVGGVWYPQDCHLSPGQFMMTLQSEVRRLGGELRFDSQVKHWTTDKKALRAVKTDHQSIEGDEFVLCGGAWSEDVVKPLGLSLPMQAGKGYSLTISNPPQMPSLCAILTEARVAVTPMGDQLRLGGTMELAGLDQTINQRRVNGIVRSIPDYYPEFKASDFENVQPWSGLRPCSPDGLPYLGRTKHWNNLVVATGHAMMGLSLAPITGKLVAMSIDDQTPEHDLRLLNPDRYS